MSILTIYPSFTPSTHYITSPPKMISRTIFITAISLVADALGGNFAIPEGYTTAVQCKCSDIEKCSDELAERTSACKIEPTCEGYLKKIGNSEKIRHCLDFEHAQMQKLEGCVKNKAGGIFGCTNDENPKNLTIPLIPLIEAPELPIKTNVNDSENTAPTVPPQPGQGPPELAHYLMCVDQCALYDDVPVSRRFKRSPVNCAFKLRCALTPPDESVQKAFSECEKELKTDPKQRFINSCNCLKSAGVNINCDLQ